MPFNNSSNHTELLNGENLVKIVSESQRCYEGVNLSEVSPHHIHHTAYLPCQSGYGEYLVR